MSMGQIYWLAGLLEGEASFHYQRGCSPRIVVVQKDKELPEKLHKWLGGCLCLCKVGNRYGNSTVWKWEIHGIRSIEIMETIYILMSEKRKREIKNAIVRWKTTKRNFYKSYMKRYPRLKIL